MTPKREKFCMVYVETGNASEAYRQAFNASNMQPETINKRASELLQNGEIKGWIENLKAQHAQRHEITVDDIRRMLLEDREFARQCETAGAAVSATTALAKLYGHMTDKLDHRSSDGTMTPAPAKIIIEAADARSKNTASG